NWTALDKSTDISGARVKYKLVRAPENETTGTRLVIRKLRTSAAFAQDSSIRSEVLRIVSPLAVLDRGRFSTIQQPDAGGTPQQEEQDPGFAVVLPGREAEGALDLAKLVLDNHWGRLLVDLSGAKLSLQVWLRGSNEPKRLNISCKGHS